MNTATYHCPMHPEVTSDKPGICHKYGSMRLVPKDELAEVSSFGEKITLYRPRIS